MHKNSSPPTQTNNTARAAKKQPPNQGATHASKNDNTHVSHRNLCHQVTRNRQASTAPTAVATGTGPAHTQLKARLPGEPPAPESTYMHCSASARPDQTRAPNLVEVTQNKNTITPTHTYSATPTDRCACGGEHLPLHTSASDPSVENAWEWGRSCAECERDTASKQDRKSGGACVTQRTLETVTSLQIKSSQRASCTTLICACSEQL